MKADLSEYCQSWSLRNPVELAITPVASVFQVTVDGKKAVLKVLTSAGQKNEKWGALALKAYEGDGAVRLLQSDENAFLLEYADGPDLMSLVDQGRDGEATAIVADTLNCLHKARGALSDQLPSLREHFSSLYRMSQRPTCSVIYREAVKVADHLFETPIDQVILHGDIHHKNIIHSSARGWLAIDPKGIFGDRTYDAANMLLNPDVPDLVINDARLIETANILADRMKLEPGRLLAFGFVHACLSACWSIEDGASPGLALNAAELLRSKVLRS